MENLPLRVLIAHNEPTVALAIENALNNQSGFSARSTSDSREIRPLFNKWKYGLLFLDMDMCEKQRAEIFENFTQLIIANELFIISINEPANCNAIERSLIIGALNAHPANIPLADAVAHAQYAKKLLKKSGPKSGPDSGPKSWLSTRKMLAW